MLALIKNQDGERMVTMKFEKLKGRTDEETEELYEHLTLIHEIYGQEQSLDEVKQSYEV